MALPDDLRPDFFQDAQRRLQAKRWMKKPESGAGC